MTDSLGDACATRSEASTQALARLVRLGLACFWRQTMPGQDGMSNWLTEGGAEAATSDGWLQAVAAWHDDWPPGPAALGGAARLASLVSMAELSPAETFLVVLLGLAESDYRVTLALAELQAADASQTADEGARPQLHLLAAMLETLFADAAPDVMGLADGTPVRTGLLHLRGDGPLPLRQLVMPVSVWSVLSGREQPWPGCAFLPTSHHDTLPAEARQILPTLAAVLSRGEVHGVVLRAHAGSGRADFAGALAAQLGLRPLSVPDVGCLADPGFALACRLAGWLAVLHAEPGAGETVMLPAPAVVDMPPVMVLAGRSGAFGGRSLLDVELPMPSQAERHALWLAALGDPTLASRLSAASCLSAGVIGQIARDARVRAGQAGDAPDARHVAAARAELGADALRVLAQPVRRHVDQHAVVFPPLVARHLDQFIERIRRRESVWHQLGPSLQASRGSGVRALFVGDSGTGKTLAASYVATALEAPLYRVDLSAIMNKYIGETEKNLAALLDRAAAADALLLFDEADSLFGRRGEARHSGERYANMLTNYLLSAIELHPGVVILTSNSRDRIDSAFSRRLDVIIDFPMPGPPERLRLWLSHLGQRAPDRSACELLAHTCDFSGGQIRNAVLAAVASPDAPPGGALSPALLVESIRREYQKLGRALPARLDALAR